MRMVKDTGASSSTIPESVVVKVLNENHGRDPAHPDYAICDLFEYDSPIPLIGFAAARTVQVRHGCVLKVCFTDALTGRTARAAVQFT